MLSAAVAVTSLAAQPVQVPCKGPSELEEKVQSQPDAEGYTNLGAWFGEDKQFPCAAQAFQAALKLQPDSAKLNYFLGLSLFSTGDMNAALEPLQKSIQLDAKAIQPRLLLATVLTQLNRRRDAETQWHAVLQIDPASKAALEGLADSLMAGGDARIAVGLLEPVQRDEDLTLDLARAYGLAGLLDQAAATLQTALVADPTSFRLINALTTVFVQQHRYQDAAALMQEYAQQHPDESDAQVAYLSALVLNSDTTAAKPLGQKLLATQPDDFNVLYLNGILEREAGEYQIARIHLLQAVKLQPENYSARFNLGSTLAHLDDAAGAKEQLEKAIALDGAQSQAHFELASVLRSLGDTPGAQEQLKIYKQLSNDSTARSQADTRSKLAAERLAAGDPKQAAALYKEAVDATPENAMLQYQLSVALDQSGGHAGRKERTGGSYQDRPDFRPGSESAGLSRIAWGRDNRCREAFPPGSSGCAGFY